MVVLKVTKSFLNSGDVLLTIGIEPELPLSLGNVVVFESHSDYVLIILDSHQLVVWLFLELFKAVQLP